MLARLQHRIGPNRAGYLPIPWRGGEKRFLSGFMQPAADAVKLFMKEDPTPAKVDKITYNLAPMLAVIPAILILAVIPWAPAFRLGPWRFTPYFAIAPGINVGVLFILAITSIGVYGIILAGWASNSKYAIMGGIRASAQMISYELALGIIVLIPIMMANSMNLGEIVRQQAHGHWIAVWPFFLGVPAFVVFLMAMLAESNRIPFDIPEAESELVAGVTTEYTGMKFALFYLAEYAHTLIASALAATLFLGGWDGPIAPGLHWLLLKTFVLFGCVYWVRWTLLRFRSDQLLHICWTWLVPAGVVLVMGAGAWVAWGPSA